MEMPSLKTCSAGGAPAKTIPPIVWDDHEALLDEPHDDAGTIEQLCSALSVTDAGWFARMRPHGELGAYGGERQ